MSFFKHVALLQKQLNTTQSAFICSNLAIETLEQDVKYVQSEHISHLSSVSI